MDQRPSAKVPATVRLAGWIILAFSFFSLNPVGIVAGFLILRYADRIGEKIAGSSRSLERGRATGTRGDDGLPGGAVAGETRGEGEVLVACPFCRKMNEPNTGKCGRCGYAM